MPTETPVHTVTVPAPRRALVGLIWGLIQAVLVLALLSAGGVAAAAADRAVTGLATQTPAGGTSPVVLAGLAAGVVAGLAVGQKARGWLQELRLRRLRSAGAGAVSVRASIDRLDRRSPATTPRPSWARLTRYTVHLHWQDPATGAHCLGERRYRLSGRRSRRLEALCAGPARVVVYYPAHRVSRFVIDVPFAPTMADLFG